MSWPSPSFGFSAVLFGLASAIQLDAIAATAAAESVRIERDRVTLDVVVLRDRVVFCFEVHSDTRISGEHGVQFVVPSSDLQLWRERMPKLLTREATYFDTPFLIGVKTRGDVRRRRIAVDLGACSAGGLCNAINFDVRLPSEYGRTSPDARCAKLVDGRQY